MTTQHKTKRPPRLVQAILETAEGMHRTGTMNDADYAKITMRHLGKDLTAQNEPVSPVKSP